ncbi:MAG: glutamate 5-kinase [Pseudomonadota bacterium]
MIKQYKRKNLKKTKRWVVKIGSALLTNDGAGLDEKAILQWVRQMVDLRAHGIELVLVSSGAIAEGIKRLGWDNRPNALYKLQAAAAVGQMGLVQSYESAFKQYDLHTAQILLTHDDLSNRTRYLNARSTISHLLELGIIPVVNENDTVVTDEIRFGDNDTLAALVANLIEADLLVILTDQNGLYDEDPRINPDAKLLTEVDANDQQLDQMAGDSKGSLGRGGMSTKLSAARLAARSGTATIIASGREENILSQLQQGAQFGTLFIPDQQPLLARKQWLAGQVRTNGQLILDNGAVNVLKNKGSSLLPVGVLEVKGTFQRGEIVVCIDEKKNIIARGLINYNSEESCLIKGKASNKILDILGYCDEAELIHRDNLVLF